MSHTCRTCLGHGVTRFGYYGEAKRYNCDCYECRGQGCLPAPDDVIPADNQNHANAGTCIDVLARIMDKARAATDER